MKYGGHPASYIRTDDYGAEVYVGDRVWVYGELYEATKQGLTRIGSDLLYWHWDAIDATKVVVVREV